MRGLSDCLDIDTCQSVEAVLPAPSRAPGQTAGWLRPSALIFWVAGGLPFRAGHETQGAATTASDAFVADWSKLHIGLRTTFRILPVRERFMDSGEIGFIGWARADVAIARLKRSRLWPAFSSRYG